MGFRSRRAVLLCAVSLWINAVEASAQGEPPEASPAAAEMLRSMREKGLLSEEEYQDLYRRQALHELRERQAASLPGWLRDWTFGGDMRVRWERIDVGNIPTGLNAIIDPSNSDGAFDAEGGRAVGTRERGRLRLGLGAERRLNPSFLVGFRIATSSAESFGNDVEASGLGSFGQDFAANPRSMNTSFGDYFAPKEVFLDRAYLSFAPAYVPGLTASFGKIRNPYVSSEFPADFLVWDGDLQLEGGSLGYGFDLIPERLRFEVNTSYAFIDEIGSVDVTPVANVDPEDGAQITGPDFDERDPYLYAAQAGFSFAPTPWLRFGARASYYDLRNLDARFAAAAADLGHTRDAIDNNPLSLVLLDDDFARADGLGRMREEVFDGFADLRFGGWGVVFFGQSTQILDVGGPEDRGYSFGFHVDAPFRTRLTVLYARVERNGTIALFTDSDLFDGFTNVKGYYVALQHSLNPHVTLRAAFFSSEMARETCASVLCESGYDQEGAREFRRSLLDRTRFQFDLSVRF